MTDSPYLIVPLITLVVLQLAKFGYAAYQGDTDWKHVLRPGGMPTTLAAIIVALAATALVVDGYNSAAFGIAAVVAVLMVARDILSVKREKQTADLLVKLAKKAGVEYELERTKNSIQTIVVGAVLGFVIAVALTTDYWSNDLSWLYEPAGRAEARNFLIGFGVAIFLSEMVAFATVRKSRRKLPTFSRIRRAMRLGVGVPALVGAFAALSAWETFGLFEDRIWTYLPILAIVLLQIWFTYKVYLNARKHLVEERTHFAASKKRERKNQKSGKKNKAHKKRR